MRLNKLHIESLGLLVIGLGLAYLSFSPNSMVLLGQLTGRLSWGAHETGLRQVFLIYAVGFLIAAGISFFYALGQRSILLSAVTWIKDTASQLPDRIREWRPAESMMSAGSLLAMLLLVISAVPRAYFLSQPVRYDEAYTFIKFVNKGFSQVFFYPLPNNHVLHTLLVKISDQIWGSSLVSLRLPAFLAGILLIPAVYLLSRKWGSNGIMASLLIGVSPYMILYSTNSRGYMLLALISAWLIGTGVDLIEKGPTLALCVRFAVLAGLGMLTVPSALYAVAGVFMWVLLALAAQKVSAIKILRQYAVPTILLTAAATILFYTPVILSSNGLGSIIGNKYVRPDSFQSLLTGILPHLTRTARLFSRDLPLGVIYPVILLALIGLYKAYQDRQAAALWILPGFLLGALIPLVILRSIPFPRTWIYLLVVFALMADQGYSALMEGLGKALRFGIGALLLIGAVLFSVRLMSNEVISDYPDTGSFPEAEVAARYLGSFTDENDRLYAGTPADWPLYYYLRMNGYPILYYDFAGKDPDRIFFVVQRSMYSIEDLTKEQTDLIFEYQDLAIYQQK